MTHLYQLTEQFKELQALASDELDADIERQALIDTLEGIQGAIEVKSTNVAKFIRNQEELADAIADAIKQMHVRMKRATARAEWLREYLLTNMQAAGISKIEAPELSLTIKKNPPKVLVEDEGLVPRRFLTMPPPPPAPVASVDKKAVADALKDGQEVPGCRLESGFRLEIK